MGIVYIYMCIAHSGYRISPHKWVAGGTGLEELKKKNINVKIAMTGRQSAGVRSMSTSEASQRLDAGDLSYAYLVGLFEGDGYFSIGKKENICHMN